MHRRSGTWVRGAARRALLGCVSLAYAIGCARSSDTGQAGADVVESAEPVESVEAAEVAPTASSTPSTIFRPDPTRLLAVRESPYGATLGLTEDAGFLLTKATAYRFLQGEAPARWAGDFGDAPALTPGHILFWSRGALRRVPTSGGEATRVATVPHRPQRLVTSGDHVAWLDQAEDGRFSIHTLEGSRPRLVHSAEGYVGTLALEDERIYFAERAEDKSWRLGLVARSGGTAHYTKAKRGRLPAMLVVAESLYFYDGPSSTVVRVSPDLGNEEVLARDIICSPLAVAEHVYCAQPAGLVEIGIDGGVRRTIPLEGRGAITALAATATRLTWVSDIGEEQLAVDSISLTDNDAPPAP